MNVHTARLCDSLAEDIANLLEMGEDAIELQDFQIIEERYEKLVGIFEAVSP